MYLIRCECVSEAQAIAAVHEAAFPTSAEARLVERLRDAGRATISLVAECEGAIAGHVLFSPVSIGEHPGPPRRFLGLAPVAVLPGFQRRGIGSALIRAGLEEAKRLGAALAVVLGEPHYYARFGFERASDFGLGNQYGAGEEFRVVVFDRTAIPAGGGLVRYAPEFAEL
jgi:putative acetyltransferase